MIDSIVNEQVDFFNHVFSFARNQKLSHVYLIETRGYEKDKETIRSFAELLYFSKKNSVNSLEAILSNDQLDSISLMEASGNYLEINSDKETTIIKKDQIMDIQEKFATKAWDDQYRIYVIYEADKLNKYAANSLLKFIEEPEEDVIGILTCSNRYRVLETIRSRCQILSLKNNDVELSTLSLDFLIEFIHILEDYQEAAIAYIPIICQNEYYSKDKWIPIFSNLELIYEQALRKITNIDCNSKIKELIDYIVQHNTMDSILYKIGILNKTIEQLDYNLNINLLLDHFVINFTRR